MNALNYFAGVLLLSVSSPLFGVEDFKLSFSCAPDDIQWAGMTCSEEEPCPVYLEASSVSSAGEKLFVAGNIHSGQTTLYSVLLRSDDRGATWQEAADRVRGEELDHVQFENSETGWVSGQRVVPLPGDPFLMITHDGGKSWRKAPVFAEGSRGFIRKFRFDSATSGKIAIDRGGREGDELQYHLYETKDGGDSWTGLEASAKPLKDEPIPMEDPVWRLRAEKSGKTVSVERQAGDGKWITAASFIVQIAACREH